MDKEILEALERYRQTIKLVLATFADATYINGTGNNQFQKFLQASDSLGEAIKKSQEPKPPTPEPYQ